MDIVIKSYITVQILLVILFAIVIIKEGKYLKEKIKKDLEDSANFYKEIKKI
jgi:hypothetical protein|tara:strand:+ start:1670 stop:1825 length:156 start_codon:yes stop_codon:yes gene_type:complete